MVTAKEVAKDVGKGALSVTIAGSYAAKYELNFTAGIAKVFLGGVENLANQMAPGGLKLGIGSYLFDQSLKGANWIIDKAIGLQKSIKGRIR